MVLDCPIITVLVEKYGSYGEKILPSERKFHPGLTHLIKYGLHIAEVPLDIAIKNGYKIIERDKQ